MLVLMEWYLMAILVACVAVYVVNFFYTLRCYPPGPVPLPLFGNLIELWYNKEPLYKMASKYASKYGDPFTIWLGPKPFVVLNSTEGFAEVNGIRRTDIAGRLQFNLGKMQLRNGTSVVLSDYSAAWENLRKVAHLAARKYATSEPLAVLCAQVIDQKLDNICGNSNRVQIDLEAFLKPMVTDIIATSAYGEKHDESLVVAMLEVNAEFLKAGSNVLPSDLAPILGWIFWQRENRMRTILNRFFNLLDTLYEQAAANYQPGVIRHFTDVVQAAKDEAVKKESNVAKYLTDINMRSVITDLFGAGSSTTTIALKWIALFLANDPGFQEELRTYIHSIIGDRNATFKDISTMPKLLSFIQEILRFYPVAPIGLPRKTTKNTHLCGRSLLANTNVILNLYSFNRSTKIFENPDTFDPERFLTDKGSSHVTFGLGARSCIGEKMAIADIFYVTTRLLQRCTLSLPNGSGSANMQPIPTTIAINCHPQDIIVQLR